MTRIGLALPIILAGVLTHATAASAATQTCVGSSRSPAGIAVARMVMEDQQMKSMDLLLSLTLQEAPGHGAAEGAGVDVQLDMDLVVEQDQTFNGLGVGLTFMNKKVSGPIDLVATIGDAQVTRSGLEQNPDGSYSARLGKGPLKGNAVASAIDGATSVRLRAAPSAAPDQILMNADVPLGAIKDREDMGLAAMDAAQARAKTGC